MITVAYERERGLRAMNQSVAGDFQVNVSKVVPVSVAEVVDALRSARRRAQWLKGADASLARALQAALAGPKPREVKLKNSALAGLRYPWGDGRVQIYIAARRRAASGGGHMTSWRDRKRWKSDEHNGGRRERMKEYMARS